MRLHEVAGLPDELFATSELIAAARAFLEGGGRISLAEWGQQSPAEREALRRAGAQLRGEPEPTPGADGGPGPEPPPVGAEELRETADRRAKRRELLAALQARGCDLGSEAHLDAELQRLALTGLVRSLCTGWSLEEAVERFERTRAAHAETVPASSSS